MRRRHALSSRFQRGTQKVELWGGTQPVFGGTERMDCFVARLGLRAQGQCPLTTYPRALAHLIAPEISVLAAPGGRTLTKSRPEQPAQMRLIRKPHTQRYLAQGCRAGHHEVAGSLQTPSHHVGMRRLANGEFEFSTEVRWATLHNCAEIPNVNGAVQIAIDKGTHAQHLPRRQPAPCGAASARVALHLRLQEI